MEVFLTIAETLKVGEREFFVSVAPSSPWNKKVPLFVVETTEKGKKKFAGHARLHFEEEKIRVKYLHLDKACRGQTGTRLLLAMGRVLGLNAGNAKTVYYERPPQRLSLLLARLKRQTQEGKLTKMRYRWQVAKTLLRKASPKVRRTIPTKRLLRRRK